VNQKPLFTGEEYEKRAIRSFVDGRKDAYYTTLELIYKFRNSTNIALDLEQEIKKTLREM
jgi:hypothetical protein